MMSPDGRRRSREHWTDTMEAGPAHPPAHVHRLPKFVRLALFLLVVAQMLTLAGLSMTMVANYRQQQYIEGRGEYRDREADRMEAEWAERLRRAQCDLLDQFPEGGWLDGPRAKYHCGPGIPIEELTPEQQAQLQGRNLRPTAPGVKEGPPVPARGEYVAPIPPRSPESKPPAPVEPAPVAEPDLLDPITETVCGLVGGCLKE